MASLLRVKKRLPSTVRPNKANIAGFFEVFIVSLQPDRRIYFLDLFDESPCSQMKDQMQEQERMAEESRRAKEASKPSQEQILAAQLRSMNHLERRSSLLSAKARMKAEEEARLRILEQQVTSLFLLAYSPISCTKHISSQTPKQSHISKKSLNLTHHFVLPHKLHFLQLDVIPEHKKT